jgi:L-lactate dehydrogenase complex protein LldG
MIDSSAARTEVLRRIRAAIAPSASPALAASPDAIDISWQAIERSYRHAASHDREAILELFEDRLRDYDAGVYRCAEAEVPALIAHILAERGRQTLAIPEGLPVAWLPQGINLVQDNRIDIAAIDACDGVLTSATIAIAETGTIILQDAPGQGRRAITLLPDYHLCVVRAETLVQTVPEAMRALQSTASLATTFFSGPSATADIEMTRIKGVHGPRFVDVILIV